MDAAVPVQLLRLLMDRDFFMENRDRVRPTMFEGGLDKIYETIVTAQNKYQHSLSIDEVRELLTINYPTETRASKDQLAEIFSDLREAGTISPDVAIDILSAAWRIETGRELTEEAIKLTQGQAVDLEAIRRIIDSRADSFLPAEDVNFVPNDLDELLQVNETAGRFAINLPSLAEKIPAVGQGELVIGFARPEAGKTAFYTSLACAPGGWAWQGHNVHVIANEEPGRRTLLRAVCAATGRDAAWVNENRAEAKAIWNQIKHNYTIGDAVGMSIGRLDGYVRRHQPDVLIIDQLDKLTVPGSYDGNHARLGALYIGAREIAKRHDCAVLAISQCSAEGEGKANLHYSMLAGSKTDKAAEADLIIGIGRYPQLEGATEEDYTRVLSVSKNKITSWHGVVYAMLNPLTSTYCA